MARHPGSFESGDNDGRYRPPRQCGADDGVDRLPAKPFVNQELGALVYAVSPLRLLKRNNFTVGASKRWRPGEAQGESHGSIAHVVPMASYRSVTLKQ